MDSECTQTPTAAYARPPSITTAIRAFASSAPHGPLSSSPAASYTMSETGSAHNSSPRNSTASGSSSSTTTTTTDNGGAMSLPPLLPHPPTVTDAQDWRSVVLDYSLRFEHIALNITSRRILYHLKLELEQPIPSSYLEFSNYLCLGWPLGGIWKIAKRDEENRFICCVAWKQTELSTEEIAELAKQFAPAPAVETPVTTTISPSFGASLVAPTVAFTHTAAPDEPADAVRPPTQTLFDWKMQLGTWRHSNHWFVREVGLPPAYTAKCEIPSDTLLSAKLFAGLTPVEVSLVVNSIQAVDTVAQRFTADVTWELTFRGITTMREESVMRELLDMLEFNENELEFSNLTDMHSEKPVMTILSQEGGRIQYLDPFMPKEEVKQRLHDLKYSRRLNAEFSEEMSLYSFPLDQQKLTFSFSMSKSIASFIPIAPPSGTPGRFALENFKLGNVWNVVCGDKLFIGDVVDSGSSKMIRFEMMLERRSAYYITNVALPAAIITYLCFISYAPELKSNEKTGEKYLAMLDTGARLQIVLTLLLTAVTFKNQVASLIPQVSYFTTLDKYVFVCFIITCAVAIENALYSMFVNVIGSRRSTGWVEYKLFWIAVWAFTFLNVVWGLYLWQWTRERAFRTKVLMAVTEYVRVIATAIPNKRKEQVLRGFLEGHKYDPKFLPQFFTTKRGDLFVKLPSDSPTEETDKFARQSGIFRKQALRDLPAIQKYFRELDPDCMSPVPSPVSSPAVSPASQTAVAGVAAVVAKQYGNASVVINIQEAKAAGNSGSTRYYAHGG